ncbi:MAG: MGMT family protein [Agarilytica sp.]
MTKIDERPRAERIYACLAQVPAGKVVTYGQLAKLAGLGSAARFVGTTLGKMPSDTTLPWWRVINAHGRISFPPESEKYASQRQRLAREDVFIGKNHKINLNDYLWKPDQKN